jgi:hypothetical protein
MRVMVTGSRDWPQERRDIIESALESHGATVVIHGCATGADTLAASWAMSKGLPPVGIPAPWGFYPRHVAGPLRNGWLLDERPDIVLAFPMDDIRGTWNAVRQAEGRGVPVVVYRDLLTNKSGKNAGETAG